MLNRTKILYLIPLTLTFIFFQNCGRPPGVLTSSSYGSGTPTFSQLNKNIFQPKCVACHNGTPAISNLTSYSNMMSSGVVKAFDPNGSQLYIEILSGAMPKNAGSLSQGDIKAVYDWIAAGALNDSGAPSAPTNLTAAVNSQSSITVNWSDNSNSETGFHIERALSASGPFSIVGTSASNATSFTDTGLNASTTYYYRVSAFSASGGDSLYTNIANATTSAAGPSVPADPTTLVAQVISSSQINLTWIDSSNNETGFKVERSASASGPFALLASLGSNITNYSDTGLTSSTTYYYRVYAYNAVGLSGYSNVANATTLAAGATLPAAPTSLVATVVSGTQINLSWTDNSTNETGFYVERGSSAAGPFTVIATLGAGVTTYSNSGLAPVTVYFYRVNSYNGTGNSIYSNVVSAVTFGTYSWLATNIFTPTKCNKCHSGTNPPKAYDTTTYAKVVAKFVTAGNASGSILYTICQNGNMPPSPDPKLSATEINAIKTWINSGAQNN